MVTFVGFLKRLKYPLDAFFFAIPFITGLIYLFSFYPGLLTFDSIYQWDQISQFAFTDWHPAYHTILIWLVTRIYYSPATFALCQIILFSGVIAYGLRVLQNLGVPTALLILLDIGISVVPINGIMEITLWKDIFYSIFVLWLSIILLQIILSGGDWLARSRNWILLGLVAANISLLRHNGLPVAFGTLLIVLLVFTRRKETFLALTISILYIGMITGPVYNFFRVNRTFTQGTGVTLVHPIAAYVNAGVSFTADETAYLNRIFPLDENNKWPYSCYDATVLFYKGVNFRPVNDDPIFALRLLSRITLEDPSVLIKHFACLSSFVWQLPQPKDLYLETVILQSQTLDSYPQWQKYAQVINPRSKLPDVKDNIIKAIEKYYSIDTSLVAMRPAIYLYILTTAVLAYVLRAKKPLFVLVLFPAFTQSLIIAFFAQLQALRYQYPVYLISMLFAIPFLYLAIKYPATIATPVARPKAGADQTHG